MNQLQRHFAYDRLLARCFTAPESDRWAMSREPEMAPPLTPLQLEGLVRPVYRVFPLVDHLADKLCAIVGTHQQRGRLNASSRVKDLVDVALIAGSRRIGGRELRTALITGFGFRGLELAERFEVPDPVAWRAGYAKPAASAPDPVPNYDEAVGLAELLFDPVLAGRIDGVWDPTSRSWR